MRLFFHTLLFLGLGAGCSMSQEVKISVVNPSDAPRANEPVVVPWAGLADRVNQSAIASLRLADESGNIIPVQVDDLDLDGTMDELTFLVDIAAHGERTLTLCGGGEAIPQEKLSVDAQNWKRVDGILRGVDDDDLSGSARDRKAYRFDGIGWESEVVGYRLYLDGRNAVDIQGKRKPGLYWKWIGESEADYQLDSDWGMDVLHVGPGLGVGGIGFWVGDSVLKPLTLVHQRARVVARGPVRSVVRVEYSGWETGTGKTDVVSQFTIYRGDRVTEHRVTPGASSSAQTLATGIVKHDSTDLVWNPDRGWLYTLGHQSRSNDSLLMALNVPPSLVLGRTEDGSNHLLLLKLEQREPVSIIISSYWQGERGGAMWSREETEAFLGAVFLRQNDPLRVTLR